ncbi:hypothetical protein AVEN_254780-1 [Araneus ventricosus]|uniref:Uncharacterized protein n=1 Tax=Araneus ventricosus TaxID=182803 RepID=A0A4Y2GES0_ARAVE|nr:hypothetical protein AVEN_254780-1 [Araneus ventricosus]
MTKILICPPKRSGLGSLVSMPRLWGRRVPSSKLDSTEDSPSSWSIESILFATGHGPFPSYLYRFRLHQSDICACGEKRYPLHYATSCHMMSSYHFTNPNAENIQLWWKGGLSNKVSRINIAKLVSFLTENETLIKQPPDATSSSQISLLHQDLRFMD